jgi:hypothetical protein
VRDRRNSLLILKLTGWITISVAFIISLNHLKSSLSDVFCREKLEDNFKVKRERLKGFNRYIKEFHKRKERIHREKLDRIQREKINLLKNNDVEGYLRMVKVSFVLLYFDLMVS